jgi:hypothetical protein
MGLISFIKGAATDLVDVATGNWTGLAQDVIGQVSGHPMPSNSQIAQGVAQSAVGAQPFTYQDPFFSLGSPAQGATPMPSTQPAPVSSGGGPAVVLTPTQQTIYRAPAGYVIVTDKSTGQKYAMWKPVARALKLWRPKRKPPISVKDWRALMRADSAIRKIRTAEKRAGIVQRHKKPTGRRTTTTTRRK